MRISEEEKTINNHNHYQSAESLSKKVNLTHLVARLKEDKKKERQNNIILSAAAVSAVAVFGIILTL
jgi:hypothetical protein